MSTPGSGITDLFYASASGDIATVNLILSAENAPQIDELNPNGMTCLTAASEQGHLDIVELFVETCEAVVDTKVKACCLFKRLLTCVVYHCLVYFASGRGALPQNPVVRSAHSWVLCSAEGLPSCLSLERVSSSNDTWT